MKIFLFYIMIMNTGDTVTYMFKDGFDNNFACRDRLVIEQNLSLTRDMGDIVEQRFVCSTKGSIGSKLP